MSCHGPVGDERLHGQIQPGVPRQMCQGASPWIPVNIFILAHPLLRNGLLLRPGPRQNAAMELFYFLLNKNPVAAEQSIANLVEGRTMDAFRDKVVHKPFQRNNKQEVANELAQKTQPTNQQANQTHAIYHSESRLFQNSHRNIQALKAGMKLTQIQCV